MSVVLSRINEVLTGGVRGVITTAPLVIGKQITVAESLKTVTKTEAILVKVFPGNNKVKISFGLWQLETEPRILRFAKDVGFLSSAAMMYCIKPYLKAGSKMWTAEIYVCWFDDNSSENLYFNR